MKNIISGKDSLQVYKNSIPNMKTICHKDKKNEEESVNGMEKIEDNWRNMNVIKKIKFVFSMITVEPILACYVMPSVLSALATKNLYLEKACRVSLNFESHVCDALTERQTANYTKEEEEVQRLVASITGWKSILQSFLPCVLLIFLGAYSDRVGQRKFCMLLPIVGEFLATIGLIVNTYFFYELPIEVAAVTEAIFPALTGGWFTMFMGAFSYIGDVTTEEQRTLRIGMANMCSFLGVPVGAALSGILVKKIGFYGVFFLSAYLYVFSFLYGFYRIKEVKKANLKERPSNCCKWLVEFFDIKCVKQTLKVAFRKGPNKRRSRVILLIVVLCVVVGPTHGELAVTYLFTRYRFNWNEIDFSIFSAYSTCTFLVGTLFSVTVFSHFLQFDDAVIGVISCISKILAGFMYAFATTTWQIYVAPLIEIFNGTSFIAVRSIVSKLVQRDELGKVNSIFGVAEAMMPLVYAPMYTSVYAATVKTFPGAFFIVGGALTFPAVLIFLWLYFTNKSYVNQSKINDTDEESCKNVNEKPIPTGNVNQAFENTEQELSNNTDVVYPATIYQQ